MAASLKAFYSALFALEVPAFARLMNPRLQGRARKGVAEILATAYEVRAAWFVTLRPLWTCNSTLAWALLQKLFDAVRAPENGYQGVETTQLHSPDQVRNLLDL